MAVRKACGAIYLKRSQEVKNKSAKLIFERIASTNNDTLTSYLSLLMTSGLETWDNRAIDAATATSDFSFRYIRRRPHAIYLVVESEMVRNRAIGVVCGRAWNPTLSRQRPFARDAANDRFV